MSNFHYEDGLWYAVLRTTSYAEFITISKEISTLENDMLELKELLGQWKDLPQLMGMEDSLAPTLDKNGNREFQLLLLIPASPSE